MSHSMKYVEWQTQLNLTALSYFRKPEISVLSAFVNPAYETEMGKYRVREQRLSRRLGKTENEDERKAIMRQYSELKLPPHFIPVSEPEIAKKKPKSMKSKRFHRAAYRLITGQMIEGVYEKFKLTRKGEDVARLYGLWYSRLADEPPKNVSKETVENWKQTLLPFA